MSNKDKKIIQATGIQILIVSFITIALSIFGMAGLILFIIEKKIIYLLLAIFIIAISLYKFIHFVIYSSRILFIDNKFIVKGSNPYLKEIDIFCSQIISYNVLKSKSSFSIKFQIENNKEYYISNITFPKKKMEKILLEIKQRNGLKDVDINL